MDMVRRKDTMTLNEMKFLYKCLLQEWKSKQPNLEKCGKLLAELKICLAELEFLPVSTSNVSQADLIISRNILEIGALWSISVKDVPLFERYMAQLKCYYFDYSDQLLEYEDKYHLLGLNLMNLLSQNRVAEFHTELELLSPDVIQSNKYISYVLSLEQDLMVGQYKDIFDSKKKIPAENYNYFLEIFLDTVRDEIAGCLEKACERISLNDAVKKLNFQDVEEAMSYCVKRGWFLDAENYYCFTKRESKTDDITFPSKQLAEQVIHYAKELEKIV